MLCWHATSVYCHVAHHPSSLPPFLLSLSVRVLHVWLGTANTASRLCVWQWPTQLQPNRFTAVLLRLLFLSVVRESGPEPPVGQRLPAAPSVLSHCCSISIHKFASAMWLCLAPIWAESPSVFQWCLLLLTIMWFGLSAMQGLIQEETDSMIPMWPVQWDWECFDVRRLRTVETSSEDEDLQVNPFLPIQSQTALNDLEWIEKKVERNLDNPGVCWSETATSVLHFWFSLIPNELSRLKHLIAHASRLAQGMYNGYNWCLCCIRYDKGEICR